MELLFSVPPNRESKAMSSMTMKDERNIIPHVFVQGSPLKEQSLMAAGTAPIMKNRLRAHVRLWNLPGRYSAFSVVTICSTLLSMTSLLAFMGLTRKINMLNASPKIAETASATHRIGELER